MRHAAIVVVLLALVGVARAGVRCSTGATCLDTSGVASPITTNPVTATGAWTFTGGTTVTGQFTSSSLMSFGAAGKMTSAPLADDGLDHRLDLFMTEDLTANRTLDIQVNDASRTLVLSGNASLNQSVETSSTPTFGGAVLAAVAFASLGAPANGTLLYCNNCTVASPCASGGTGALAKRLNGAWVCN